MKMGGVCIFQLAIIIQIAVAFADSGQLSSETSSSEYRSNVATESKTSITSSATTGGLMGRPSPKILGKVTSIRDELEILQFQLKQISGEATEVQTNMLQDYNKNNGWVAPIPDLLAVLNKAFSDLSQHLNVNKENLAIAQKMIDNFDKIGSDIDKTWVQKLRIILEKEKLALSEVKKFLEEIKRVIAAINRNVQVYREAKEKQKIETEEYMENCFNQLDKATSELGKQALEILTKARGNWATLLAKHCEPDKLQGALSKLKEVTTRTMKDLEDLHAQDIESAITDCRDCIEDVKSLLVTNHVPIVEVKKEVIPVQLAIDTCANRAKSVELHQSISKTEYKVVQ